MGFDDRNNYTSEIVSLAFLFLGHPETLAVRVVVSFALLSYMTLLCVTTRVRVTSELIFDQRHSLQSAFRGTLLRCKILCIGEEDS